jgi:hypothetical protein
METSAYQSINIDTAFKMMIEGKNNYFIFSFLEIFGKFHKQLEETPDEFNFKDEKGGIDLNATGGNNTNSKKKPCC